MTKRKPPEQTTTRTKKPVSAYERMVTLLSRRDHSTAELRAKLKKADHSEEEIEETLEFARSKNWLPDESVLAAREFTRLARAGKSPSQIASWLKKKGLPTKGFTIDEADFIDEEESAYKTASKAWARLCRTAQRDTEKAAKRKLSGKKKSSWGGFGGGFGSSSNPQRALEESLKLRVSRLLQSRGFSSVTARSVFTRLLNENPL